MGICENSGISEMYGISEIAGISRFGLLELSRQRLRPSLEETYDIQHVQVRGTRSLGQSILRIIGEDAAKDNTGEINVYVPVVNY